MFEVSITKKDMIKINDFLESGILVKAMNDFGLTVSAMALILNSIVNECERVSTEMGDE